MTNTFTQQDFKMINDLKEYAKAIKFELKNENDLQILLKKWVNHRVNLTSGQMDTMFNNFLIAKNI
ncbi:hypothetical protein [Flavobacterium sp.]|uniref:hypothetical protein n=1 Tax=Flavobacterium sp. TaxID=239 RepID=UPI0033411BFA